MKIEENTMSVSKLYLNAEKTEKVNEKDAKNKKVNNIQASNLNLADDSIAKKRKQAQKMAMSLMSDVFENEKKIDDDLQERQKHINELTKENEEYADILKGIKEQKEELKESFGITDDSKETNPEGYKQYQEAAFELNRSEAEFTSRIKENQKSIVEENVIITGVKLERLKSHDMVDAKKQGKQIVTAANKEIIGMLCEEVKENQDKKLEEQQEAADKKKEEAESLEKRIEAAKPEKEKYANKFSDMDDMYKLGNSLDSVRRQSTHSTMQDIKKSLNQVISELKLTAEDLKGAVVDKNV